MVRNAVVGALVAIVGLAWLTPAGTSHALIGERVIVSFDAPPTAEQLEVLAGVADGVHGFQHLPAAAVSVAPSMRGLLARLPGVLRVDTDASFEPLLAGSTATLRADGAWDLGWTGEGVGIAVIDTGIDGTHPDLCAIEIACDGTGIKTTQNLKVLGRETVADPVVVVEDQVNSDTSSGHGSHVASIAAGYGTGSVHEAHRYRGVAPGATLVGLSVGEAIEAVNVLAAFDWIIEHRDEYAIKVVNNSWGPGRGTPYDPGHPVQRAIDATHAAGITVIFGAGNDGPSTDTLNAFSANPRAISVAGGDKAGHIAFFSSRGIPGSDQWAPTVTAPGYNIVAARSSTGFYATLAHLLAPNPDPVEPPDDLHYVSASGTSMAAPHVAGVVALVQQAAAESLGRSLTPDEVAAVLQRTAVRDDDGRGPGGLPRYQPYSMGAGYVDAVAATTAVAAGDLGPFVPDTVTDVRAFAGRVGPALLVPTDSFAVTYQVLPGAISLDVMLDWPLLADDVDLDLYGPSGALVSSTFLRCDPAGEPNGYSSFCSSQPNERTTVVAPEPGVWRAVVRGGLVATSTDVDGLWSVVYPAGTALPAPPAPASVEVAADPLALSVTGVDVEISVVVRGADGVALPNVPLTWSSSGTGEVAFGETATRLAGVAQGSATAGAPGSQRVTVTAGEVSGSVDVTWLGLDVPGLLLGSSSTAGRASGGGAVDVGGVRHTLGFHAELAEGASSPGGELIVRSPHGPRIAAKGVDRIVIDGDRATVTGPATVDDEEGFRFRLVVRDRGEPGRGVDEFDLRVTQPLVLLGARTYEIAGTLSAGNLQVRAGG